VEAAVLSLLEVFIESVSFCQALGFDTGSRFLAVPHEEHVLVLLCVLLLGLSFREKEGVEAVLLKLLVIGRECVIQATRGEVLHRLDYSPERVREVRKVVLVY